MAVLGIDVSHHNGVVDWFAVSRSNVRFAYAKATEGRTFVDGQFARNWERIRDAGLLRGAYHFARPAEDPVVQAVHFTSVIGDPSWGELPPALDLEVDSGRSAEQLLEWTGAFLAHAEAAVGRRLVIYTGGLWRRLLARIAPPAMASHVLWTARYATREPVVPPPWSRWDIWQFTDGQSGNVQAIDGVRGPCDCNRFRGDMAELQALADLPATPAGTPTAPTRVEGDQPVWPGRFFVWPKRPAITGEDVRRWQARLSALGFSVTIDGIYGPESRRASQAFQRIVGLDPDGIVGPDTWKTAFEPSSD